MATDSNNRVFVELYDLTLTDRVDDRFGRVVTTKFFREDDLISLAVSRRTDLNPVTLKASLDILKEVAVEQVANGASVQLGLGFFSLEVKGVFVGDHASWDPTQHSLHVKTAPTNELRQVVQNTHVNVRGMANVGAIINTVRDVSSGEENSRLTPGGGVNLAGSKIKLVGDSPLNGIRLINQGDGSVRLIPPTAILVSEPKKVTFVVPADLPAGDYKLSLTTQFSSGTNLLNEPRTYLFDYVLAVNNEQ
jgi:hypothetical protein